MEDFPSKYLCFLLDPWSILAKKDKEENTVTYQESPPWLPTMFKTPCVETILYPEFSRSNRQANIRPNHGR